MLAYMEIADADRLKGIAEMDARYHLAMLMAQGFGGGAQIVWDERNAWRDGLFPAAPASEMSREDHMALALRVQRQLAKAGLIPTDSGAN
jgi:hypothetical protein